MASTSAAIVKRSFVMEKDIRPGLVFEVEITYPRSRIAINSIYGVGSAPVGESCTRSHVLPNLWNRPS